MSGCSGTEGQWERNCSVGKHPVTAVQTDTLASLQHADNSSPPPLQKCALYKQIHSANDADKAAVWIGAYWINKDALRLAHFQVIALCEAWNSTGNKIHKHTIHAGGMASAKLLAKSLFFAPFFSPALSSPTV